jgi:methyl-accepting chemotaxis protein
MTRGFLISHPKYSLTDRINISDDRYGKLAKLLKQVMAQNTEVSGTYIFEGVEKLAFFSPLLLGEKKYIIAAAEPLEEFLSLANSIKHQSKTKYAGALYKVIGIALGIIFLCVLTALGFAKSFTTPIKQIIDQIALAEQEITSLSGISHQLTTGAKQTSTQSNAIAATTEEMSTNINTIATAAEQMNVNVQSVSSSAEQMSQNMNAVAATIEEMSVAIGDVAESAKNGLGITGKAMAMSDSATGTMNLLGKAAKEIGDVTAVIKRVAEQTNLLALNASIEAASAGPAGRGFAIVAREIKELANQSSQAAENITRRIEDVQTNTVKAVNVIGDILTIIKKINESAEVITHSVEQQTVSANEISGNVQQASNGTNIIASSIAEIATCTDDMAKNAAEAAQGVNAALENIRDVSKVAEDSNLGARQVDATAAQLAKIAAQIQEMTTKFNV